MTRSGARPRIGPRTAAVIRHVMQNPGCYMIDAACVVAPRGSLSYGYATVHRALKTGRIRRERTGRGYQLYWNVPLAVQLGAIT